MSDASRAAADLQSWLVSAAEIVPSLAEEYAARLVEAGVLTVEGLARADRALLLELVKADDAEEIQDALQRMGAEEVFDNRSSWHMRTLVAECSGVVERLRAAEEEAEAVEVLNTLVSMAENSRDLQEGLARAGSHLQIISAGARFPSSEAVAEGVFLCVSAFCRYGDDKSASAEHNVRVFGEGGAAAVLVALLKTHFANTHLLELGCEAVCCLGVEEANRTRLGDAGACEVLGRLLVRFCADPTSCQPVCRAVGYTAFKHAANAERFAEIERKIVAKK